MYCVTTQAGGVNLDRVLLTSYIYRRSMNLFGTLR
jgi:hypothetical protein